MTLRRLIACCLILGSFSVGIVATAPPATAGNTAAAPSADCSWRTNGQVIDGKKCHCERVTFADGSSEIWCSWLEVAQTRSAIKVVASAKRRHHAVPRFGIGTAVISKQVPA